MQFAQLLAQAQNALARQAIYFAATVAIFAAIACSVATEEARLAKQAVINQESIQHDQH